MAGFLGLKSGEIKKFDVFVFELRQGNISKGGTYGLTGRLSLRQSIRICDQLLEGLIQLESSKISHNDLKPENVLFNCDQSGVIQITISDFGQAGRTGGTPGWTWPKFLTEREPGKSDLYSVALLTLYVMCDDREVFYRIRNNYIEGSRQQWLSNFRSDPFFKLIMDMMNLKVTPKEAKTRWDQISGNMKIITKDYLTLTLGVNHRCLRVQDGMDFAQLNLASPTLLDG